MAPKQPPSERWIVIYYHSFPDPITLELHVTEPDLEAIGMRLAEDTEEAPFEMVWERELPSDTRCRKAISTDDPQLLYAEVWYLPKWSPDNPSGETP